MPKMAGSPQFAVAQMNDKLIRAALLRHLESTDPTAVIYHELPLSRGEGRADCAAVNGSLTGFEIKSEKDSLSRLEKQIQDYEKVFDFCNIVVATKHLRRARALIPNAWGIIVAEQNTEQVHLSVRRKARRNSGTSIQALIRLMWKTEALAALRKNGKSANANIPVRAMWFALEDLGKAKVATEVRIALKQRAGFPVPQLQCGDSPHTEPTAAALQ